MSEQQSLIPEFDAHVAAAKLGQSLTLIEDPEVAFATFTAAMDESGMCRKVEAFDYLEIVGFGLIDNCLVWTMRDGSSMIAGWKSDQEIAVGVLPPGVNLEPILMTHRSTTTIH